MNQIKHLWTGIMLAGLCGACASARPKDVSPDQAAKLDRQLIRDAVVFEPGTKDGAIVPEISAPRLRAILVPDTRIGNRLVEKHREWILDGDVSILGIPRDVKSRKELVHDREN